MGMKGTSGCDRRLEWQVLVTARLEGYPDHSTPNSFPKHPDRETKGHLQANNRLKPLRDEKIKDKPEVIEEIQVRRLKIMSKSVMFPNTSGR